jgi:hypothetical protein
MSLDQTLFRYVLQVWHRRMWLISLNTGMGWGSEIFTPQLGSNLRKLPRPSLPLRVLILVLVLVPVLQQFSLLEICL